MRDRSDDPSCYERKLLPVFNLLAAEAAIFFVKICKNTNVLAAWFGSAIFSLNNKVGKKKHSRYLKIPMFWSYGLVVLFSV